MYGRVLPHGLRENSLQWKYVTYLSKVGECDGRGARRAEDRQGLGRGLISRLFAKLGHEDKKWARKRVRTLPKSELLFPQIQ